MNKYSRNYSLGKIRESFCRLFVIGILSKMNLNSFTTLLERSDFVNEIETKNYDRVDSSSLEDLFFNFTKMNLHEDNSRGIYNDAYWCGYIYFELHLRMNKPFSYLFLKLPLSKLLDMYPVYHEMDITQVEECITSIDKDNTIVKLLCKKKKTTLAKLSKETGISINTIKKYASGDEHLYAASFQNIVKISRCFDTPLSLFVEKL